MSKNVFWEILSTNSIIMCVGGCKGMYMLSSKYVKDL